MTKSMERILTPHRMRSAHKHANMRSITSEEVDHDSKRDIYVTLVQIPIKNSNSHQTNMIFHKNYQILPE